jgi:hypothetical protein
MECLSESGPCTQEQYSSLMNPPPLSFFLTLLTTIIYCEKCVCLCFQHLLAQTEVFKENEKIHFDDYAQHLHNLLLYFPSISQLYNIYQSRCSGEELRTVLSPQEVIVLLRCCCTKLPQLCPTSRFLSKAPNRGTHKVLTYI